MQSLRAAARCNPGSHRVERLFGGHGGRGLDRVRHDREHQGSARGVSGVAGEADHAVERSGFRSDDASGGLILEPVFEGPRKPGYGQPGKDRREFRMAWSHRQPHKLSEYDRLHAIVR